MTWENYFYSNRAFTNMTWENHFYSNRAFTIIL